MFGRGNSQRVQTPALLQKVTKETKSHSFCPGPSFPSLPSVKSEWEVGVWLRLRRARKSVVSPVASEFGGARANRSGRDGQVFLRQRLPARFGRPDQRHDPDKVGRGHD